MWLELCVDLGLFWKGRRTVGHRVWAFFTLLFENQVENRAPIHRAPYRSDPSLSALVQNTKISSCTSMTGSTGDGTSLDVPVREGRNV